MRRDAGDDYVRTARDLERWLLWDSEARLSGGDAGSITTWGVSLQIAAGLKYGKELAAELAAMQVRVSSAGREQFGAWREGTHDDLVLAVALACWGIKKVYPEGRGLEREEAAGDLGRRGLESA